MQRLNVLSTEACCIHPFVLIRFLKGGFDVESSADLANGCQFTSLLHLIPLRFLFSNPYFISKKTDCSGFCHAKWLSTKSLKSIAPQRVHFTCCLQKH